MWLVFTSLTAHAGLFSQKTMHRPWPERQTQAEFVLPRGWMRFEVAADTKSTGKWRDDTGTLRTYENNTRWSYSRAWLKFDLGLSSRIRLYLHAPWVRAGLRSDLGTRIHTTALGDIHSGAVFQPFVGKKGAVAGKVDLKAPSGVEWPRNFLGGPTGTSGFLTGTGCTNLGLHGLVRYTPVPALALRLDAAFVWKIAGVTGYVVEKDGFGNGWLDPGDELRLVPQVQVNVAKHLAIQATGTVSTRLPARIGISGEGVTKTQLEKMPGTGGTFVDLGLDVHYEPHKNLDFGIAARHQLLGADTTHFAALGLEEFSPQPGTTIAASVGLRW